MTARWRALVLLALLGAPLAACSDDGPGEGEARLEVNGEATVERADGERETIDDSTDLGRGDRVSITEGVGVMRLRGGTTFELRKVDDEDAGTTVVMDSVPVLEAGDLLVTTPESTAVEADGTEVQVREGAARVTRAFGMSASAYDADLEIDSAGVVSDVPALRQMVVPDLGRPRPARPVDYDEEDPWDRRYLGAAMAVGKELEVMAEQLTGELAEGEGRTIGFLRLVLPGLEDEQALVDFGEDLSGRDPGDNVIGAAITELGEHGSFPDRWEEVFGFRDEGAAWGIVALDQEVRSEPLIGSVEQAFNTSVTDEVAQGPDVAPPPDPSGSGGTDGEGTPASGGSTDGGGDGGTDGTGTDGTAEPTPPEPPVTTPLPPVTPPADPGGSGLAPLVEPVEDLLEDLLGGLLG